MHNYLLEDMLLFLPRAGPGLLHYYGNTNQTGYLPRLYLIELVLPKSSSVQFFAIFAELRTGLMVWFKQLAEL